jgi:ubiquinone/menaquinone biosynthesis C-methylase UbiE
MSMLTPEEEVRQVCERWSRLAPGACRNSELVSEWSRESDELLLGQVEIGSARAILDLACGAGDPTLRLARACPNARVVGLDCVEALLGELARRARGAGLANAEARLGNMLDLPFDGASFDTVTCRFGLSTYGEETKRRMLAEARRVLVPGGRLVMVEWGSEGHGAIHSYYEPVLRALGGFAAERPPRPASDAELARLLESVGFESVEHAYPSVHWRWSGTRRQLWDFMAGMVPPIRAALAPLSDGVVKEVAARIEHVLAEYQRNGEVALPARNAVLTAVR